MGKTHSIYIYRNALVYAAAESFQKDIDFGYLGFIPGSGSGAPLVSSTAAVEHDNIHHRCVYTVGSLYVNI